MTIRPCIKHLEKSNVSIFFNLVLFYLPAIRPSNVSTMASVFYTTKGIAIYLQNCCTEEA